MTESAKKYGILIIETKAELGELYKNILTKSELYDVIITPTPKEALTLLDKEFEKVNLILFDWSMPEIPGFAFCQKIRSDHRFNNIEMCISSADVDEQDSFLMTEMDVHHVIPKLTSEVEFLTKINEVKDKCGNPNSVVSKLKDLQSLMNDFQLDKCEELFKVPEIEKEINENPRYVHLGGEVRIIRKKYDEAIEFLKDFLSKNTAQSGAENLKSLSTLGRALCLSGKFEDAILIFDRLELKSPKNLSHKINAADALIEMNEVDKAEEKLKTVLAVDPENKDANLEMGKASAIKGDFDTAKTFFSKIEGNFESRYLASFFNNRGVALVRQGKINEAITFYENALQFLDKFKGQVYFNLGMAYYRIGKITPAVHAFQAALKSQEAPLLQDKTILKDLHEKGIDKFVAEYLAQKPKD